jgi:hypothetical protein
MAYSGFQWIAVIVVGVDQQAHVAADANEIENTRHMHPKCDPTASQVRQG